MNFKAITYFLSSVLASLLAEVFSVFRHKQMVYRGVIFAGFLLAVSVSTPIHGKLKQGIDTGHIIKAINYVGLNHVSEQNLPDKSTLYSKLGRRANEADVAEDIRTLYLTGYFSEVSVYSTIDSQSMELNFTFIENPLVQNIVISGNRSLHSSDLTNRMSTTPGHVLNINTLALDKSLIEKQYFSQGYTLSTIDSLSLDPSQNLIVKITEGYVGDIHINGLKPPLKSHHFTRDFITQKGDPFNSISIRKDRDRLFKSGYFSDVSSPYFPPNPDSPDSVDIDFTISNRKVNLLNLGLEQEDEEVVGFLRLDTHHIFQTTDFISTKLQIQQNEGRSYDLKGYNIKYVQPWLLNKYPFSFTYDTWTEFNNEYFTSDIDRSTLYETKRIGQSIKFGFKLIKDLLFFNAIYKDEKVMPESGNTFSSYEINSITGQIVYNSVTNLNNPSKGTYWTLDAEKGGNLGIAQLSGLDFSRVSLRGARFISLNSKTTLGVNAHSGVFFPFDDTLNTFDSEGFTLGGANSLRGYKETHPFIGDRLMLMNIEYRYQFSRLIQGVIFYDIGKTFNDSISFSYESFYEGKGIGIRFFTPVGPIRFDLGWGEDMIIHFGLGQMF